MLYLILLGAFLAALGGAYFKGEHAGKTAQLEVDNKKIVAAETRASKVEFANSQLEQDVSRMSTAAQSCSKGVQELRDAQARIQPAIAGALASYDARSRGLAADIAARAAAAASASSRTPDQQCANVRATLNDLADKVRGIEPPVRTAPLAPLPPVDPPKPMARLPPETPVTPTPGPTPATQPKGRLPSAIRIPPK